MDINQIQRGKRRQSPGPRADLPVSKGNKEMQNMQVRKTEPTEDVLAEWLPKDTQDLIPVTYVCGITWQTDFADVIKVTDLKIGRLSWIV